MLVIEALEDFVGRSRLVWVAAAIVVALAFLEVVGALVYLLVYLVVEVLTDHDPYGHALIGNSVYQSTLTALLTFGVVAAIFFAVLRRRQALLRDCPSCFSSIPAAAGVCRYCSSDVEP